MRLFMVDDNYNDMGQFRDELILEGHEVIHAHNHDEIRSICERCEPFDGIILDLMFPPENGIPIRQSDFGYRAGEYLYESLIKKTYPSVPFVILTAMDRSTSMYQQAINKMSEYPFFRGCLQKPVEVYELIESLSKNTHHT